MSFLKLSQKYVLSRTCPGHVPDMSRTCTQNFPALTILGHQKKCTESICPMSFFYFSNFFHVLAQNCLKMCPRPDMSRTRPGRVPDLSSKFPCPDYFGTSPNRTSATKIVICMNTDILRISKVYTNQLENVMIKSSINPFYRLPWYPRLRGFLKRYQFHLDHMCLSNNPKL